MPTMLLAAETSAGADAGFPLLTALIALPLLVAVLVALTPSGRTDVAKALGLFGTIATFGLSLRMLAEFETGEAGFQLVSKQPWISDLGISWHVGVDGISLWLVVLTAFLFPLSLLGASEREDVGTFTAWILLLEAAVLGVFLSLDLFLFFVFFEVVLVPMYFLIGLWGHGQRIFAATKFFLYTMSGSALMLVGMLALVFLHREATGVLTFDVTEIAAAQSLATETARWLFLAFGLSFAVKVPLFPLHTWLPDAHTEAPTAGSVILAGVLLKLGTYGFIRFGLYLFPEAADHFGPLMATLAVIGITYGAIVAAMQKDLKRLVAYSSVAHMGFIILGTFAVTTQGVEGGLLQMVNHGVSTGALFLLVGMIYQRRHTRLISELGGLQKAAPVMAAIFTVVMLSSIGLPGLNGFVGEFLVLVGSFEAFRWWTVMAASGVILAAVYLLWAYQRSFHGTPGDRGAGTAARTHRVHGRVPQARTRPDGALGRPAGHPRSGSRRHARRARRGSGGFAINRR
jgi:NADH-quinone oxidoreductase subunit M